MNWKTILAAGAILFSGTPYAQTPDGMISYWKFDEGSGLKAFDAAGDNHGTLKRGPQWTVGQVVNALSFDGHNDYVQIPNSNSLNFTEAVTAEAWVKPNGNPGHYQMLLEKGTWVGNASWYFFIHRNAGYLHYNFGIGIPGGIYAKSAPMIGNLEDGEWSHIVGTYDRQYIKFYVNGVLNKQVPWTQPIRLNSHDLYISRDPQNWYYKGDVDEVAIYNRALTACEIQQHYQNGLNGIGYFGDADCDGVPDDDDFCPNTAIPEGVPTVRLGTNRWALVDDDFEFETTAPKGKGPNRSYLIDDTAGCSCEQIIEKQGLGNGHTYHGCSISAMDDWVELVNP